MNFKTPEEALKFAAFISEAMAYVDCWTPTYINEGGCAHFAKMLHTEFDRLGIQHEILVMFSSLNYKKEQWEVLSKFLFDNEISYSSIKIPCEHVMIRIGELYIDSEGISNDYASTCIFEYPINETGLDILIEQGGWRKVFDKKCLPGIKSRLTTVFDSYDLLGFSHSMFPLPKHEISLTWRTLWHKAIDPIVQLFR